ncbi:PEP/pyruvate-binding domain-containing protein [Paenibacillus glycinis]|uniref:Phosphoenolpyruvate synthase n=1 Tax=Paenibacillus glycinis TaxID=2697035 RepID=A0ABW9XSK6_9BACL|nr:PEP/pyruvate-binding domain-containing protein [Paenibacillus glycinis]NBD25521.1 phosphoenolpyruvate synthase [Paenibacillus glycinis]
MLTFTTKAESLEACASLIQFARILPQIRFTVNQWNHDRSFVMNQVKEQGWLSKGVIVRSSAIAEDSEYQSLAGKYMSVLHINNEIELERAVHEVIFSYDNNQPEDQVFIQPMLHNVTCSGVAFTRDPHTSAPYYVINYDDRSGQTDTITAGSSNELKTFYIRRYKRGIPPLIDLPINIEQVVKLLEELMEYSQRDCLDVEFAFADNTLYLLQVRPLIVSTTSTLYYKQEETLSRIADKINQWNKRHPYLFGERTLLGVMPDWNPAEIIGIRPRPLAMSLYKELITNSIWASQRANYGYRDLHGFPLMVDLNGLPYIDVRVSFNSFLPSDLSAPLCEKLINHYLSELEATPAKHDKVEFDIVFSCFTFDIEEHLQKLGHHGFSTSEQEELRQTLLRLTNRIIGEGLWKKDLDKIQNLVARHALIMDSPLDTVGKIYWLLEDCKRYGTLPFAGLARAGFIAVQLLQSLVHVGIMNEGEKEQFMRSLSTISEKIGMDYTRLEKSEFLQKYGHLRPGTYDLLSARYDEEPDHYFDWEKAHCDDKKNDIFYISLDQMNQINALLMKHGILGDVVALFNFIKISIESREYAKYIFTKSLSDALRLFELVCEEHGISKEEATYANIRSLYDSFGTANDIKTVLETSIELGRTQYEITKQIVLPPLIGESRDLFAFHLPPCEPNFVTQKKVTAPVTILGERKLMEGSIVFTEQADPGYDWVFTQGIVGFVTLYGGRNSHMAIRAGELGIPAVIGAGESLYRQWAKAKVLEIDAINQQVKVIQ